MYLRYCQTFYRASIIWMFESKGDERAYLNIPYALKVILIHWCTVCECLRVHVEILFIQKLIFLSDKPHHGNQKALHISCKNRTSFLVCYYSYNGRGNHTFSMQGLKKLRSPKFAQQFDFLPVMTGIMVCKTKVNVCWNKRIKQWDPSMSPLFLWCDPVGSRVASNPSMTYQKKLQCCRAHFFQPTHFPRLTNPLVCDMKWNFFALNYETREFKHSLAFGRRPIRSMCVCVGVRARMPVTFADSQGHLISFMWTARTLLYDKNCTAVPTFMYPRAL